MGRRKKGNPVHGWVILDKPQGLGSTQAVAAVRRIFDAKKAGHAGTLDPMATGILAIALGEATKTVPYAMDADKTYRFTATWGESRDSDDAEGKVTGTSDKRPSRAEIEAVLPRSFDDETAFFNASVLPELVSWVRGYYRSARLGLDDESFQQAAACVRSPRWACTRASRSSTCSMTSSCSASTMAPRPLTR